jgi:hypothetical protein
VSGSFRQRTDDVTDGGKGGAMNLADGQTVQDQFVARIAAMLADDGGGRQFGHLVATLSRFRCDVFVTGRVWSWDLGDIPLDDAGRAAVAAAFADAKPRVTTYDGRRWLVEFQGRTVES